MPLGLTPEPPGASSRRMVGHSYIGHKGIVANREHGGLRILPVNVTVTCRHPIFR
jgi:hypothetical protein